MHNGGIPHFSKIKLQLLNLLDADCFQFISGSTDSEHIFALFLSLLPDRSSQLDVRVITDALETTISVVLKLCELAGLNEACSLNLVVSDGIHVVATRFRNGTEAPPSLYYNYGNKFLSSEGTFQNPGNDESCEIVISSAPLCKDFYMEEDDDGVTGNNCGWRLAPKNTFLVCDGDTTDHAKISNIYIQTIHLKSARYLNKRLKIGASSFLSNFHLGAETSTAVLSSKQAVFPSPKRPESNSAGSMVSDQAMTKISEIQTSDSVESKSTLSTVTQTEDIESMESSRGEATALTSELSIYKKIFTHKSCAVEEYSQITPSSHCANDVKKTLRQPTFDKVPCCPEPHVVKTKNSFRASKTTLESYDIASKDSVEFLASLGSPFDTVNVTNSKKSPYKRFNWWWVIFDGCWKFLVLTLLIYIVVHSRKLNCETCPS